MILEKFFFNVWPHEEPARQEIQDKSLSQEDPLEMGLGLHRQVRDGCKDYNYSSLENRREWCTTDKPEKLVS